jgi:hypothetical protein|tara:strand:+ start:10725 stop:11957 length:1233 start_codon:yes stop_codon:yes gene_type:complete
MNNQQDLEKVASQVGVSIDALESRMKQVSDAQSEAWKASGYDDDKIASLTLRISARQLHSEKTKIANSGATVLEGMVLRSPRYKDWGKLRYDKMTNQLKTCDDSIRSNLIEQGAIVYFENNHDGTWTRHINESLRNKEAFEMGAIEDSVSAPHAKAVEIDENTMYYIVADKSSPTWPSGDSNWRYGAPSPVSDKKRTVYFLGRKQGSNDDISEIQLVFSGDMAETSLPTFVPGSIAVKMNAKGTVGYAKAGVTALNADPAIASIFPNAPVMFDGDVPAGMMVDALGGLEPQGRFLKGFDSMASYLTSIPEDEKWTAYCGLVAEVVHIDPRDNGGYTVTLGDLDILSSAPTQDIWVGADQEHLINFGVGSQVAVFGTVWQTKEGEHRFSCQGWYVVETVEAISVEDDGWDN